MDDSSVQRQSQIEDVMPGLFLGYEERTAFYNRLIVVFSAIFPPHYQRRFEINIASRGLADVSEIKIQNKMPAIIHFKDSLWFLGHCEESTGLGASVGLLLFEGLSLGPKDCDAGPGNAGGYQSDYVQPSSDRQFPSPIVAFLSFVLFIGGLLLSDWGFRKMPLSWAHVAGWLLGAFGGSIFLLWAIPFVAEKIPAP